MYSTLLHSFILRLQPKPWHYLALYLHSQRLSVAAAVAAPRSVCALRWHPAGPPPPDAGSTLLVGACMCGGPAVLHAISMIACGFHRTAAFAAVAARHIQGGTR